MEHLKTFYRRKYLLWELVKKGVKLKYRRSYLGIFWSLLEPLLTTIILTVVFGTLFGNTTKSYPLYILCGRLMYTFFSAGTKSATRSIRSNAAMIKKVYVPKYLYPMSSILFNFVIFALSLIILVPLTIYCQVSFTYRWFYLFIPLILIILLTFGVGIILATIAVFFRDMEYLWDVSLMFIMYTAAIFYYPERLLKSGYAFLLNYNPLYCVISVFRACLLGTGLSNELRNIIFAAGFSVVSIVVGTFVFYKKQNDFILHI